MPYAHPRKQAARERAPRDHAEPVFAAGGKHFEFGAALDQVVQALLGHEAELVSCARTLVRLGDFPSRKIAGTRIRDLALADQQFHR